MLFRSASDVWVTYNDTNNVTEINSSSDAVVATFSVGATVTSRYIATDGTDVWVANYGANNYITEIATADLSIVRTITGIAAPGGIAVSGGYVWVTGMYANNVTEIDSSGATVATVSVGTSPSSIVADASGVWVINSGAYTVSEINPTGASAAVTHTFYSFGPHPFAIAASGTNVWTADLNTSSALEFDGAAGTLLHTVSINSGTGQPGAVALAGGKVWVADELRNNVTEIQP